MYVYNYDVVCPNTPPVYQLFKQGKGFTPAAPFLDCTPHTTLSEVDARAVETQEQLLQTKPQEICGAIFGDPRGGELLPRACLACPSALSHCCRRARFAGYVDTGTFMLSSAAAHRAAGARPVWADAEAPSSRRAGARAAQPPREACDFRQPPPTRCHTVECPGRHWLAASAAISGARERQPRRQEERKARP